MMLKLSFENPIIGQDMAAIAGSIPERKKLFHKNIFISGAAGMIPSYIVFWLVWLNEFENADIQIYAGIRNKEKASARFGDYLNKDYFHLICRDVTGPLPDDLKIDYIMHAASPASPQFYGSTPVETMLPNILGTYRLLEYCRTHEISSFLFFSSGSVYGTVTDVPSIQEDSIGKFDFLAGGNVYGEAKRCGEALSMAYRNEYQVPVKIARIHHTYGPTADIENDSRVFSEFINNIVHRQNIILKSPGKAKRAFCYITDTVSGILKIMLSETNDCVYNIGNPDCYVSIAELAEILTGLFPDRKLTVERQVREQTGYSSSPEQRIIPLNVDRLLGLGWTPEIRIEEGFERTVKAIEYR